MTKSSKRPTGAAREANTVTKDEAKHDVDAFVADIEKYLAEKPIDESSPVGVIYRRLDPVFIELYRAACTSENIDDDADDFTSAIGLVIGIFALGAFPNCVEDAARQICGAIMDVVLAPVTVKPSKRGDRAK